MKSCSVKGCEKSHLAKGLCSKHYQQAKTAAGFQLCTVEDCEKTVAAKGLCPMHYSRMRLHGDPLFEQVRVRSVCTFDGCRRSSHAQGLCDMHYQRFRKHGDAAATKYRDVCALCEAPHYALGFCNKHYMRLRKSGSTETVQARDHDGMCRVDGCTRPHRSKYLCSLHYQATYVRPFRRSNVAEPILPEDVFSRDDWVCQLCFEKIDPSKKYPDRWAATIDHIVPVSKDGPHVYDNVQAAHLSCNCRKGNRVLEEQAC